MKVPKVKIIISFYEIILYPTFYELCNCMQHEYGTKAKAEIATKPFI